MKTSAHAAELWPYSERNGVFIAESIQDLLSEPEVILSEAEKQEAYDFARDLSVGQYNDARVGTNKTLEAVKRTQAVVHRQSFYTEYLAIEEAHPQISALLSHHTDATTPDQIMHELRSLVANGQPVDAKQRKLLAANSEKWYRKQMTERLLDNTLNPALASDFEHESIDFKPSVLLEKSRDIQAYRTFYRAVKRDLRQQEGSLVRAKQVLADVHLARANNMLADIYPAAVHLAYQLDDSPVTELTEQWRRELFEVAPVISEAWKHENKAAFSERFMERLDRIRNGIGLDEQGKFSSISNELGAFVTALSQPEVGLSIVDSETIKKLETTTWHSEQVKQFVETVLDEWEWLSSAQVDWAALEERNAPADDGKWQVVISPKVVSLGVNNVKKTVMIPEDFDRVLLQQNPSGVLPVVAHELTHVVQKECDDILAKHIPLAETKGRQTLTGSEMGGVLQESIVFEHFGKIRNINVNYLRATQAKLRGGNQTEVAIVYMNAKGGSDVEHDTYKAANTAAKVIPRLYRYQGYNTQPLDYLEQAVMLKELRKVTDDEVIAAISMASTSFSLHDSAAIHRVDLLDIPTQAPKHPADDVLRIYFERFHETA